MKKALHCAINEYTGQSFTSFNAALKSFSRREILDIYLKYEGIIGYTDKILSVMTILGFDVDIQDPDFVVMDDEDVGFFGPEPSHSLATQTHPDTFINLPLEKRESGANRSVYALGLALAENCPKNDCQLFLNKFNMCRELDEQAQLFKGWPLEIVKMELRRLYHEIEGMYYMNHAIRQYRKELKV